MPPISISFDQLLSTLRLKFDPDALLAAHSDGLHPWIVTSPDAWPALAHFLKTDPALSFSMLRSITGLDYPDKRLLCAAYDLLSFKHRHELCIKIFIPRDDPAAAIPSVAHLWPAANWHEREAYDLLGINFSGHPDSVPHESAHGRHPRRILLPDDWLGHPLRKDYLFPRDYQGIPGSVELDWQQKTNYPK